MRKRVAKFTQLLKTTPQSGARQSEIYYSKNLGIPLPGDIVFYQTFNAMYTLLITEVDMTKGKESFFKAVELNQVGFSLGSSGPAFLKARSDLYIFEYPRVLALHPKKLSAYVKYEIVDLQPYQEEKAEQKAEQKEDKATTSGKDVGLVKYIFTLSEGWQRRLLDIPYVAEQEIYSADQLAFFCLNLTDASFDLFRTSETNRRSYANTLYANDNFWRFRVEQHYGSHIPGLKGPMMLGDADVLPEGYTSWFQLYKRLNRCAYVVSPLRRWKMIESVASKSMARALSRSKSEELLAAYSEKYKHTKLNVPLEISLDPGKETTIAGYLEDLDIWVSLRHSNALPLIDATFEWLKTKMALKHLFLIDSLQIRMDDEIPITGVFSNEIQPIDLIKVQRVEKK
jgi:hypothetical protein